jgi:acyl dehydratase
MAGKFYEELEEGATFVHQIARTITETDNVLITLITMNQQPLHLDEEFAKTTQYGTRIVNSLLTLGLTVGLSVGDISAGTTIGNLGYDKVEFPNPVFVGDTIRAETTVTSKRESKSHPDAGVVHFEHRSYNQRGDLVCVAQRTGLMRRRS